jgi:hypothetical protein
MHLFLGSWLPGQGDTKVAVAIWGSHMVRRGVWRPRLQGRTANATPTVVARSWARAHLTVPVFSHSGTLAAGAASDTEAPIFHWSLGANSLTMAGWRPCPSLPRAFALVHRAVVLLAPREAPRSGLAAGFPPVGSLGLVRPRTRRGACTSYCWTADSGWEQREPRGAPTILIRDRWTDGRGRAALINRRGARSRPTWGFSHANAVHQRACAQLFNKKTPTCSQDYLGAHKAAVLI